MRSAESLEHNRWLSREAKKRRRGTCVDCGAETCYAGHGQAVSERCAPCAAVRLGQARMGTGFRGQQVLNLLTDRGEMRFMELADAMGVGPDHLSNLLDRLLRYGLVVRVRRGVYTLP